MNAAAGCALVTGGAVRIGAVIAERLARDGYAVAIHCNRSTDEAGALAHRLSAEFGVEAHVLACDLAHADPGRLVDDARQRLGRPLDVLINSASVFLADTADDFVDAVFADHINVNLRAPLILSDAFARQARPGAAIVNLSDQRVLHPSPRYFTYTLSKCALHAATRTMAQAFAPHVRVNAVAPGLTLANARQNLVDYDRRIATLPLRRGGSPEEVADVVAFLIRSPSITGQTIAVDGGQHLAWQTPDAIAS